MQQICRFWNKCILNSMKSGIEMGLLLIKNTENQCLIKPREKHGLQYWEMLNWNYYFLRLSYEN